MGESSQPDALVKNLSNSKVQLRPLKKGQTNRMLSPLLTRGHRKVRLLKEKKNKNWELSGLRSIWNQINYQQTHSLAQISGLCYSSLGWNIQSIQLCPSTPLEQHEWEQNQPRVTRKEQTLQARNHLGNWPAQTRACRLAIQASAVSICHVRGHHTCFMVPRGSCFPVGWDLSPGLLNANQRLFPPTQAAFL